MQNIPGNGEKSLLHQNLIYSSFLEKKMIHDLFIVQFSQENAQTTKG